MTTHMPPVRCLNCDRKLAAATYAGAGRPKPKAGDLSLCLYCGHLAVFGSDFLLRELNDAEIKEVAGDRRLLAAQQARTSRLETYLGDGLYAKFEGYAVELRAPRDDGDHYVVLEPDMLKRLIAFVQNNGWRITE